MSTSMNADEGNFPWTDFLQCLAMFYGNKPIFSAMNNVDMAFYFWYPSIGT
jgi:hypothetical protein